MRVDDLHVREEEDPPLLFRRVVAPRQEVGQHIRPHVLADLGVEQRGDEGRGELDACAQTRLADQESLQPLPDARVRQPRAHLHRRGNREGDEDHGGQENRVEEGLAEQLGPETERGQAAAQEQQLGRPDEASHGGDGQAREEVDARGHSDGGVGDVGKAPGGRVVRDQKHLGHEQPDHPEGDDPQDVAPGFRGESGPHEKGYTTESLGLRLGGAPRPRTRLRNARGSV